MVKAVFFLVISLLVASYSDNASAGCSQDDDGLVILVDDGDTRCVTDAISVGFTLVKLGFCTDFLPAEPTLESINAVCEFTLQEETKFSLSKGDKVAVRADLPPEGEYPYYIIIQKPEVTLRGLVEFAHDVSAGDIRNARFCQPPEGIYSLTPEHRFKRNDCTAERPEDINTGIFVRKTLWGNTFSAYLSKTEGSAASPVLDQGADGNSWLLNENYEIATEYDDVAYVVRLRNISQIFGSPITIDSDTSALNYNLGITDGMGFRTTNCTPIAEANGPANCNIGHLFLFGAVKLGNVF